MISDIHYDLNTLTLADTAMRQAISKANYLKVPLIVAGDLHNTKANLRAECVNAMLETFKLCETHCYILRGNHDQINEKSEEHSLNFLKRPNTLNDYNDEHFPSIEVVEKPHFYNELGSINGRSIHLIPYYHDVEELRQYLKIRVDKGSTIIMHQGIEDSHSGEYIQDKSALSHEDVKDYRVISGHYHRRQTIDTGDGSTFQYIGNPFTLNFGEVSDPEKGFQILMSDGLLEFVPTKLRKHIVINVEYVKHSNMYQITGKVPLEDIRSEDIVWVKVSGTKEHLITLDKPKVSKILGLDNFRLDFIPLDTDTTAEESRDLTQDQTLDSLIDSLTNTSDERKANLKELWRKSICS